MKQKKTTSWGAEKPLRDKATQVARRVLDEPEFAGQGIELAQRILGERLRIERTARGAVRMLLDGRDSPIQRVMMEAKKVQQHTDNRSA